MHRSQRTGAVTWRDQALQHVAAVVDGGAVAVGEQEPGRVGGGDAGGDRGRAPASAGAMYWVWNAPATCSGMSRALAGGVGGELSSCSSAPAATIWPAPLRLAG